MRMGRKGPCLGEGREAEVEEGEGVSGGVAHFLEAAGGVVDLAVLAGAELAEVAEATGVVVDFVGVATGLAALLRMLCPQVFCGGVATTFGRFELGLGYEVTVIVLTIDFFRVRVFIVRVLIFRVVIVTILIVKVTISLFQSSFTSTPICSACRAFDSLTSSSLSYKISPSLNALCFVATATSLPFPSPFLACSAEPFLLFFFLLLVGGFTNSGFQLYCFRSISVNVLDSFLILALIFSALPSHAAPLQQGGLGGLGL